MVRFVDADWPWLVRVEVGGVSALPPRRTAKLCGAEASLDAAAVKTLSDALPTRLASA